VKGTDVDKPWNLAEPPRGGSFPPERLRGAIPCSRTPLPSPATPNERTWLIKQNRVGRMLAMSEMRRHRNGPQA